MEIINIDELTCIGQGSFARVYKLSPTRVIKVYERWSQRSIKIINRIMGEEVRLSRSSPYVLPVLKVVLAKKKVGFRCSQYYYAVIKKYIPHPINGEEWEKLRELVPKKLQWDCSFANCGKDEDGNLYLIDAQGPYTVKVIYSKGP